MQFWLGPAPIVFTASGVTAAFAYLAMPAARDGSEILQIWLQASDAADAVVCTCFGFTFQHCDIPS